MILCNALHRTRFCMSGFVAAALLIAIFAGTAHVGCHVTPFVSLAHAPKALVCEEHEMNSPQESFPDPVLTAPLPSTCLRLVAVMLPSRFRHLEPVILPEPSAMPITRVQQSLLHHSFARGMPFLNDTYLPTYSAVHDA